MRSGVRSPSAPPKPRKPAPSRVSTICLSQRPHDRKSTGRDRICAWRANTARIGPSNCSLTEFGRSDQLTARDVRLLRVKRLSSQATALQLSHTVSSLWGGLPRRRAAPRREPRRERPRTLAFARRAPGSRPGGLRCRSRAQTSRSHRSL